MYVALKRVPSANTSTLVPSVSAVRCDILPALSVILYSWRRREGPAFRDATIVCNDPQVNVHKGSAHRLFVFGALRSFSYFDTFRVLAAVLYFSVLQIDLMQQDLKKIMKDIEIDGADLKSIISSVSLCGAGDYVSYCRFTSGVPRARSSSCERET